MKASLIFVNDIVSYVLVAVRQGEKMMVNRILEALKLKSNQIFSVESEMEYTYFQLNICVNKMTNLIHENNWLKIALCVKQGFWGYAAIISSYLAGATFCVINPELSRFRIESMLSDFQPDILWINEKSERIDFDSFFYLDRILLEESDLNHDIFVNIHPNKYAYVMFTSGTTDKPKGCKIIREGVQKVCEFALNEFPISSGIIYGQYVPLHFDMSLIDVFCGVAQRAVFIVFDSIARKLRPANVINEYKVEFMNVTPQFIDVLMKSRGLKYELLSSLKAIRFGGDKIYRVKVQQIFCILPNIVIFSTYGATETTLFCMCQKIRRETLELYSRDILSIGKTIPGWEFQLVDVDENGIGEIVILGDYIGDGYLGESGGGFGTVMIDNVSQKAYFTGDYARMFQNNLYFEGRRDCQIKINGQRGSLYEVEASMIEIGVDEVVAMFVSGSVYCYYVNANMISRQDIQNGLRERLPQFMIPTQLIEIENMPYSSNGKIDKLRLIKIGSEM